MPRKKYGNTPKEEQEKAKSKRKEALEEILQSNPFDRQIARYGSNGKMFDKESNHKAFPKKAEYDKIVIDPPEDLSEEVVSAIVMGAIMRPDRLDKKILTSSSIGSSANVLGFNQCMVINNYVSGDNRVGEFKDLIPQARQEAKDAIEEYKKGNKEPAKKMLSDYIDACVLSSRLMSVHNNAKEEKKAIKIDELQSVLLGAKLLKNNPLNAGSSYGDIEQIRLLNLEKQQNAKIKGAQIESQLLDNPPAKGSNERKSMVEDILFYSYLRALAYTENGKREEFKSEFSDKMMNRLGVEIVDVAEAEGSDYEKVDKLEDFKKAVGSITDIYSKHQISDFQMILSKPDGEAQLKRLYHDAIIKSDEYKDMVEAEPGEIYDMIRGIRNENLEAKFPGVKVPNEAKDINAEHEKALKEELKNAEKQATKVVIKSNVLQDLDAKEYGIESFDAENLRKNAKIISDMYDDLDANDSWYKTSSDEFKNVKKELKNLKKFAQELADKGTEPTADELKKYDKMARNIAELSDKYLDYKSNPKGDYENSRVNAVGRLKRHIISNRASLENVYSQKEEEKDRQLQESMSEEYRDLVQKKSAGEKVSQYCKRIDEVNKKYEIDQRKDVFYGDKYTDQDIKKYAKGSEYSLTRIAAQTTSIIAMAMKNKYTMEQLLNPEALKEEKAAMFDDIFKRMTNKTPENQKYLANIYYKGMPSAIKLMDDYEQKIDYTNPELCKDEKFIAYNRMAHIVFDTWQEMAHCKEELMELVQQDYPEMKEFRDYADYMSARIGPNMDTATQNLKVSISRVNNDPESYGANIKAIVISAADFKVRSNEIIKENEKNREVPFSQRFAGKEYEIENKAVNTTVNAQLGSFGDELARDTSLSQKVVPKIIDGSMFKDLEASEVTKEGVKLKGLPSVEQLRADIKYEDMEMLNPGQIREMTAKAVQKYDKQAESASPMHKTYIEKAKNAVVKIKELLDNKTPLVGEQREVARNCVRDILTEKMVGTLEKSGAKIPENAENVMAKTVESLPVFEKNTEYLGFGFLGEMAYEDKSVALVKESMADIQKNLDQVSAQKAAEKALENEAAMLAEENKEIKQPVVKNDNIPQM